jgi:mRNA-degrading endonuclease RelE of RelBE toxin-antitoxin system
MAYEIKLAPLAKAELAELRATDRSKVLAALRRHLTHRPNHEEGSKKLVLGEKLPWSETEDLEDVWRLRVEHLCVYYDVFTDRMIVYVRSVRPKLHGQTTKDVLR